MISDKVRPHHLERKALLYVRQSSAHQVLLNRESSALQYAMRDRLIERGEVGEGRRLPLPRRVAQMLVEPGMRFPPGVFVCLPQPLA